MPLVTSGGGSVGRDAVCSHGTPLVISSGVGVGSGLGWGRGGVAMENDQIKKRPNVSIQVLENKFAGKLGRKLEDNVVPIASRNFHPPVFDSS